MKESVKPNPPRGKPRVAVGGGGHDGLRISYFEDELLEVPVPEWVDPCGYQEVPSSVALPALLRCIQQHDLFCRGPDSSKRRRRRLKKMLKNLASAMPEPARRHELNDAVRTARAMHNYPTEKIRATALEQFAGLYPQPVAHQRWPVVSPEVYERARENDRSVSEELVEAVKAAAPQLRPTSSPERSFEANLRQQLNDLVTTHFLGPDWRKARADSLRRTEGLEVDAEEQPDLEDALLRHIDNESFLAALRTHLSPRERELLEVRLSGVDYRTWAKNAWGVKDSTIDNTMSRVREKGRGLARGKNLL